MSLQEILSGGVPRIAIGFYQPGAHPDRTRILVSVPMMVWEQAEKVVAILTEHGAVERWGVMVAPLAQCEAIGSALSKAGFVVLADPDALAAGRIAAAAADRAAKAERN